MEKWFVETKRADFDEIASKFGISPITARLIRNRDITGDEKIALFLNGKPEDMYDPYLLKDMDKGIAIMKAAVEAGKKIRVIGDYDIDGICSSYILEKGITHIGGKCDVRIPHRMIDGYGLNDRLIDEAIEDKVELIITCDNGIAASASIKKAKDAGITVIVTDHHEVPFNEKDGKKEYILPAADAVIDPKREDDTYPFKEICGGVVAYKFVKALLSDTGKNDETLEKELFSFGAFATIGDVMPLTDENHIIVKYGLKELEKTTNIGLTALMEKCDLKDKDLKPHSVGFVLGPCLNASGRLDSAIRGLELLESTDRAEAVKIANELKELNVVRQELTEKGIKKAIEMVENDPQYKEWKVLSVYLPEVHESLAGIIAGKLRERYGKPVFVLTDGEDAIKGSGRSIDAYNMFEEMTKVKDIFVKFGGHKLAAGLSIKKGDADEFARRINESCTLTDEDLVEKVMIDVPMPLRCINNDLIDQMKALEPYGTGNRTPLFAEKNVKLSNVRVFGNKRNVVKGLLTGENNARFNAVFFGDGDAFVSELNAHNGVLDVAYTVQENTWRGNTETEVCLKHVKF